MNTWLIPDWEAPPTVRAFTTTRAGGVSGPPYDALNLGAHCGDRAADVARNRALFRHQLPEEPGWLRQVHGARVAQREHLAAGAEADAVVCRRPGLPCTVLTADCLPVLLCDRHGSRVGAAHAGWRGLVAGVLEATVAALGGQPGDLMAWIGPGISAAAYEVGSDFRDEVLERRAAFGPAITRRHDRLYADLAAMARLALREAGVKRVSGGQWCTHADRRFYSHRREGRTGRMATTVWLERPAQQTRE